MHDKGFSRNTLNLTSTFGELRPKMNQKVELHPVTANPIFVLKPKYIFLLMYLLIVKIGYPFNCIGWNAENQSIFVGENLGPTMAAKGFADIKIMIVDDQRNKLPDWVQTVCINMHHMYHYGATYEPFF